jgi:membrane-bound metal-dependent hydrolase YbcI (DUF457 family)
MLDWKIHLIFGCLLIILWLNIFYFLKTLETTPSNIFILIVLTLFTSIFPDVDLKKSKARDISSIFLAFSISITYIYFYSSIWYYGLVYFILLYFLFKLIPTKHRGITHTFKFSFVFSAIVVFVIHLLFNLSQTELFLWFAIIFSSYSLHLFLDSI